MKKILAKEHKDPTASIAGLQEAIIQDFAKLGGDRNLMLDYIIDLGEQMQPLTASDKLDVNLVPGCLSKVWLVQHHDAGCLLLHADSNTAITKGLASLLVRVFSHQPLEAVVGAKLFLMEAIGMSDLIGPQRGSGLEQMIKHIKRYASRVLPRFSQQLA